VIHQASRIMTLSGSQHPFTHLSAMGRMATAHDGTMCRTTPYPRKGWQRPTQHHFKPHQKTGYSTTWPCRGHQAPEQAHATAAMAFGGNDRGRQKHQQRTMSPMPRERMERKYDGSQANASSRPTPPTSAGMRLRYTTRNHMRRHQMFRSRAGYLRLLGKVGAKGRAKAT